MNTQENEVWIEPMSSPELSKPAALLETASDTQGEINEPADSSRRFSTADTFADSVDYRLSALNDW